MKTKIIQKNISKNSSIICVEVYLADCESYIDSEQKYDELYESLNQYRQKNQIPILACSVTQNSSRAIEAFKILAQMLNIPLHVYLKADQMTFDEFKQSIKKEYFNTALTVPYEILKQPKTVF